MILVILVIIRLPVFLYGYPLLLPELTWQIIGEKMGDGFVLYRDVWTTLEPFSAGTYFVIDGIFGKSQFVYQFLTLVLIFLQAIIFNFVLSINNLYPERTYVPALLYVLFSSLFLDFYTLSPPLLGMTFIIVAFHFVFFQIRTADDDENVFYTGILIAIASLFYFPYLIFILLAILSFLFFSGAALRKYLLLIIGFVFPFLLVGVYFFLRDALGNFLLSVTTSIFSDTELLVSGKTLGISLIVPLVLMGVSVLIIYAYSRYINYQYVAIRIFSFWIVLSLITLYLTRGLSAYHLFVFVPTLAFFATHFFTLVKNNLVREISFAVCVIVILWINYHVLYQLSVKKDTTVYGEMIVKEIPEYAAIKNKKILVLGNERSYYNHNQLATPYLNWDLAQKHFQDLDNYHNVSTIYGNFKKDMPEVIIDEDKIAPKLFERLPELKSQYELQGKNMYIQKGKK
jgi:hypothetical protein